MKKILGSLLALVMVSSTIVPAGAQTFTDVENNKAIESLASLGIISGYEDGTFKPDNNITRAEAITMVVNALNMSEDAEAASTISQFEDVNEQASWAAKYVNVGVAQNFIHGMGDGTFAPMENITYAQMCVILSYITGYAEYANSFGGYPSGYTSIVQSAGINKGVSVSDNTTVTRKQVAQLIYNALVTPELIVTEYTLQGNSYGKADGKNNEFKTILSDKFDGYLATITINSDIDKSSNNKNINITVVKADYLPQDVTVVEDDFGLAKNNLYQTGEAIILFDDNDKAHLITFTSNGNAETLTFNVEDFVKIKDNKITFENDTVRISDDVQIAINNVIDYSLTADDLEELFANSYDTVTFTKEQDYTYFNKIQFSQYTIAKVAAVIEDDDELTIQFGKSYGTTVNELVIDLNEDLFITGCAPQDIKKNDIVAIRDFETDELDNIVDYKHMEIIKGGEVICGKVTSYDAEDNKYFIDGKEYTVLGNKKLETGTNYEFTLDPFGHIFSFEVIDTNDNYGIFLKYNDAAEEWTILTSAGTKKVFEEDNNFIGGDFNKGDIVKYTVRNSTGCLKSIELATTKEIDGEYREITNRVDGYALDGASQVVYQPNASEYTYELYTNFLDEVEYKGLAVIDNNTIKFALITEEGAEFNEDSRFAVAASKIYETIGIDDDVVYGIDIAYQGTKDKLLFENKPSIALGQYFYYKLDSNGYAEFVEPQYDEDIYIIKDALLVDIDEKSIEIYTGTNGTFTEEECDVFGIDADCQGYKFNDNATKDNEKIVITNYQNIVPTILIDADDNNTGLLIPANNKHIVRVTILIVDKNVVEIYATSQVEN